MCRTECTSRPLKKTGLMTPFSQEAIPLLVMWKRIPFPGLRMPLTEAFHQVFQQRSMECFSLGKISLFVLSGMWSHPKYPSPIHLILELPPGAIMIPIMIPIKRKMLNIQFLREVFTDRHPAKNQEESTFLWAITLKWKWGQERIRSQGQKRLSW